MNKKRMLQKTDARNDTARGEELKERLSHGLHDAILEESEKRGQNIVFLLFLINSPRKSPAKRKTYRTKVRTTQINGEKTDFVSYEL